MKNYLFIWFSVAQTSSVSYGDIQLFLMEADPSHTNIGIGYLHVWIEPLRHCISAGRPPHLRVFAPTGTRTHSVRG